MRPATETAFANPMPLVVEQDRDLSSIGQTSKSELYAQRAFVHRLEEARSKNPMNLDSSSEQLGRLSIDFLAGFRELPGGSGVLALHTPVSDAFLASST